MCGAVSGEHEKEGKVFSLLLFHYENDKGLFGFAQHVTLYMHTISNITIFLYTKYKVVDGESGSERHCLMMIMMRTISQKEKFCQRKLFVFLLF